MAQKHDTWSATKGDITVTVSKKESGTAGERLVVFLKWLASKMPVDPDYGVSGDKPSQGGERPDNTLPGQQPRPEHPIAPGGPGNKPSQGGERPDNTLPGAQPGVDNSLPGQVLIDHAEEIAKIVLAACFDCRDGKPQPK